MLRHAESRASCAASIKRGAVMSHRTSIAAATLVATLAMMTTDAVAWDDAKYIDLKGQWVRASGGMGRYDPTKPPGRGQQAPLTPE